MSNQPFMNLGLQGHRNFSINNSDQTTSKRPHLQSSWCKLNICIMYHTIYEYLGPPEMTFSFETC